MAYSSGFNPHPRISFANPAPTSAASEAEYLELGLSEVCDPAKVQQALNDVLPPGFEILDAMPASKQSLGELLQVTDWRVEFHGMDPNLLMAAAAKFESEPKIIVERLTKSGKRLFDVKAAVLALDARDTELSIRLRIETPLVRPDDVVTALRQLSPELPTEPKPLFTRLEQGPFEDQRIKDPLRQGDTMGHDATG